MASNPPSHIDLSSSNFNNPQRLGSPSPRGEGIPSPRSGDVPPALSPLDAFALQGRLLAAKFEEQDGRRISRLPPLTVANEFAKPRPSYFARPQSPDPAGPSNTSGVSPEVSRPSNKHMSFYPSIQGEGGLGPDDIAQEKSALETVSEEHGAEEEGSQEISRSQSAEDGYYNGYQNPYADPTMETSKVDFAPSAPRKAPTNESLKSNSSLNHGYGLVPPRSPLYPPPPRSPRNQPSIRSVRMDSGDDSDALSFQSDPYDLSVYHRKASLKSSRDRPRSPFSPTFSGRRSPSISSEISNSELQQPPRRSMNFSRPLSPANRLPRPSMDSRPSFDQSTRTLTADSPPVRPSTDGVSIQDSVDILEPPQQPFSEEPASNLTDDENASNYSAPVTSSQPGQSFVYRTYTLPRGRKVVSRGSFKAESWLAHQFEWDHPSLDNNTKDGESKRRDDEEQMNPLERQPTLPSIADEPTDGDLMSRNTNQSPNSSVSPPRSAPENPAARSRSVDDGLSRPVGTSRFHEEGIAEPLPQPLPQKSTPISSKSLHVSPAKNDVSKAMDEVPALRRKSEEHSRRSEEKSRRSLDKKRSKKNLKAQPAPNTSTDPIPAEEHLAKGIQAHEEGSLQKSTYHLRLAARAGLPPAMLLYALACRHGWGMRPNQQEGVLWLRKAVDLSRIEVDASDLLPPSFGGIQDKIAARQHKAQLALAIYELGVSYLNGWGIQQDKHLALRCFEIAAGWGDADALAEAGFCFAKGVGCKKDLAKAAGYYRRAEAQGISMAGNSW